jgi:hypothetical protein
MAIAFVQEWDGDPNDRTTTNYDAINAELAAGGDTPDGLIVHSAGFVGDGVFRIFDVWESEEHANRFMEDRLMPIVQKRMAAGGSGGPPDRQYTYELHDVIKG